MTTKFELPLMTGNALKYLRVNSTETGYEWATVSPGAGGYTTVFQDGVASPQESDLNFLNYFIIGNVSSQTTVNLDVEAIATDTDFIDALVADSYFLTELASSTDFIDNLVAESYFITNLAIELAGNVPVVTDGVTATGDGTTGDPISVIPGPTGANTALSNLAAVAINTALLPGVSNTIALGSATFQWADLFLGNGGQIDWNNGGVTISVALDALIMDGQTEVQVGSNINPQNSNTQALGTSSSQWADLFLGSGAVINFNNGDVTITHSANALDIDGGVVDFGSTPTVNGAPVITSANLSVAGFQNDQVVVVGVVPVGLPVPDAFNGKVITAVLATVYDQGVTGSTTVQLIRRRSGSNVNVLSSAISLGAVYFAANGTINTSNDDLATGDLLFIEVVTVHSGTPPNGLSVVVTAV